MSEWQDISTAPRDGTRVLLWTSTDVTESDRTYVRDVCEGEHVICAQIGLFDERGEWDRPLIGEPLFWQPLPAPPKEVP